MRVSGSSGAAECRDGEVDAAVACERVALSTTPLLPPIRQTFGAMIEVWEHAPVAGRASAFRLSGVAQLSRKGLIFAPSAG